MIVARQSSQAPRPTLRQLPTPVPILAIPFPFILLPDLVRSLRSLKKSTPVFSSNSALFGRNTRGGIPSGRPASCAKAQKCPFLSALFATLTHSLPRKSFPCHSYANTRVGYGRPVNAISKIFLSPFPATNSKNPKITPVFSTVPGDFGSNSFVWNRSEKPWGRGGRRKNCPDPRIQVVCAQFFFTSLLRYVLTSFLQGTRMIFPAAPDSITSLCARAASASGICFPTTGLSVPFSMPAKSPA